MSWKERYARYIGYFTGNGHPPPQTEVQFLGWVNAITGEPKEDLGRACLELGAMDRHDRNRSIRAHAGHISPEPEKPKRSWRFMTASVIFFTALMATVWDIVVFVRDGVHSTISQVTVDWLAWPPAAAMFGFLCGFLACHFFGWWMKPNEK